MEFFPMGVHLWACSLMGRFFLINIRKNIKLHGNNGFLLQIMEVTCKWVVQNIKQNTPLHLEGSDGDDQHKRLQSLE